MKPKLSLEELEERSEEDLLMMLGEHLHGRPAVPPSSKALMEAAAKWLDDRRDALAQAVCANVQVQEISRRSDGNARRLDIAAAIADAIIGLYKGVPVAVISLLLAKEGIHTFCQKYWG